MPEGIGYGKKAKARVSPEKARKILSDGKVNGKPLTAKQRRFFGAIASSKKRMPEAQDGAAVSSRSLLLEGMQEGGMMVRASGIPTLKGARADIMQGMQEGGGTGTITAPTFEGSSGDQAQDPSGLIAILDMYNKLESQHPGLGRVAVNSLILGLASAENIARKQAGITPDKRGETVMGFPFGPPTRVGAYGEVLPFEETLHREVARAYEALKESMLTPTPTPGSPPAPPVPRTPVP